jgi:signal peptidase
MTSHVDLHLDAHARGNRHLARDLFDGFTLLVLAAAFVVFWPASLGGSTRLVVVEGHSMEPTYHFGDLVVARANPHPKVGEIIVYRIPKGDPAAGMLIIHRVKTIRPDGTFETQGDNRTTPDPFLITPADIAGSPLFAVPHAGRLIGICSNPPVVGAAAGLLVVFLLWPSRPKRPLVDDTVSPPEQMDFDELARRWLEDELQLERRVGVHSPADQATGLLADTYTELGELALRLGGPSHLGHAQQPWEAEVFDFVEGAHLLGPQRRLDALDALIADAGNDRGRVPVVGAVDVDVARPASPQRIADVVPHVEVRAPGR